MSRDPVEPKSITLPLDERTAAELAAGDEVRLTGTLFSARDQAHQRLSRLLEEGRPLPFPLEGSVIYYMGPAPTPPGQVVGSAGPTTASRMDPFAPALMRAGLAGMIGKGPRSAEVDQAIRKTGAKGSMRLAVVGPADPTT